MARLYLFGFAHHLGLGVPIDLKSREGGSSRDVLAMLWIAPGFYFWVFHQPSIAWPIITELILWYLVVLLMELSEPDSVSKDLGSMTLFLWLAPGLYWWWFNDAHIWWPIAVEAGIATVVLGIVGLRREWVSEAAA